MDTLIQQSRSRPGFEVAYLIGSLAELIAWQESEESLGYETAWNLAPLGGGQYWASLYARRKT